MSLRTSISRLATTAFVGALLASPAAAQLQTIGQTCGGITPSEYNLCYSINSISFLSNTLTINVSNLTSASLGNTHMSEFLIAGLVNPLTVTSVTVGGVSAPVSSGTTSGSLGLNGAGLVGGANFIGYDFNGNTGIAQGQSANVVFTFANATNVDVANFSSSAVQLAFQVQGATAPCASTKGVFSGTGERANGTFDYSVPGGPVSCSPPTTTPEPASLALMGTGLLAVGGLGLRRRRGTV